MTQTKHISQSFGIFVVAVTFYGLFYSLNEALIQSLDELPGASLFRLSSGIKLMLVLLLGWLGSAAIAAFCFIWTVLCIFPGDWILSAEVALAAGLVPLVVCHWFEHALMPDLSGLNWGRLFQLSLCYAALNSVVRACIVALHLPPDVPANLVQSMLNLFCADVLGIFLALHALRLLLLHIELPRPLP